MISFSPSIVQAVDFFKIKSAFYRLGSPHPSSSPLHHPLESFPPTEECLIYASHFIIHLQDIGVHRWRYTPNAIMWNTPLLLTCSDLNALVSLQWKLWIWFWYCIRICHTLLCVNRDQRTTSLSIVKAQGGEGDHVSALSMWPEKGFSKAATLLRCVKPSQGLHPIALPISGAFYFWIVW